MSADIRESVLDKFLTFTYHTQAFATGLTSKAGEPLHGTHGIGSK
jgi:hypothetical protein